MCKILITGASGFIGRNLVESLQYDYDVYAPRRDELNLHEQGCVESYLKENCFDIIIHAANTNNTRRKETTNYESLDGNLRMFFNLQKCRNLYGKMYYFGSGAEYDNRHYLPLMKEEYLGTHIPVDSYGFSKFIMSSIIEDSSNIYDLCLFGVYGKYEEWERRFISNAICRVLKGKDILIQKNVYFDYLWIDDLTDIVRWFIKNEPKYHRYNVCKGSKIDLISLAGIVKDVLGSNCNIIVKEEGLKPEYSGDNSRLLAELGEYTFTDYEKSIEQLCNYYKGIIKSIPENAL